MKKAVFSVLFFICSQAADNESQPLLPKQKKLSHPLTIEQLEQLITPLNNTLDLREHKNIFCPHNCCVNNFAILSQMHPGLALICSLDSKKDAQKLEDTLAQYQNRKFVFTYIIHN